MKHHISAIRLGCSAALLVVLSACGLSSAQPTLPTNAPAPSAAPQPPESAPTTQPPAGITDTSPAVQVVLDYYDAIEQKQYDAAYGLWAQKGTASGQTRAEFEQGYANTAGVSVLLDKPTASNNAVVVPSTILSVLNQPNQDQKPQRFTGTYTLSREGESWRIVSATIAETDAVAEPPVGTGDALQVLQAYYQAIDDANYPRAYSYWENNGQASQQSYAVFVRGFAETDKVTVTIGQAQTKGAAGSAYTEVPVVVIAQQRDGRRQSFCGNYTLRRTTVPPFDTFGWRIYSASILKLENAEPNNDTIQRLLAGQCAAR